MLSSIAHRLSTGLFFAMAVLAALDARCTFADDGVEGIQICLDDGKVLTVQPFDRQKEFRLSPNRECLAVWSDGATSGWQYIGRGGQWAPPRTVLPRGGVATAELFAQSRGQGGSGNATGTAPFTVQVDQLLAATVFRGKGFLTPHSGRLLDGKIVIRRRPNATEPRLPAVTAVLQRGQKELARIPLAEDQATVHFREMTELIESIPDGLPAGEYTLRIEGSAESTNFVVEEPEYAASVLDVVRQLANLLEGDDGAVGDDSKATAASGTLTLRSRDPLFIQVAVESLLDQRDTDDKPIAYLTDALNLLDGVSDETLSIHLRSVRANVIRRLGGEASQDTKSTLIMTGIPVIDRVRKLMAAGNWRAALDDLDKGVPDEPRAVALGKLHRAVIEAQSGLGTSDFASQLFREAISELKGASAEDRFLALTNAGNFYLNHAQDQLYNHAFQMATGSRQPLVKALKSWRDAATAYQVATAISANWEIGQRAGLLVNAAQLQVLLADMIQTLDAPDSTGHRLFQHGEAAATSAAGDMASQVTHASPNEVEPLVRAAAAEIQAQLAYRARAGNACQEHSRLALKFYLDAGSLVGAEGIHRLLGMYQCRSAEFAKDGKPEVDSSKLALKHFLISMQLAEILRSRIPSDQFGLSHAGFFARRAYVNEQLIELLVNEGRAVEALNCAEQAKARSLQELLTMERAASKESNGDASRSITDMLREWPEGVAAIEYFLGTEKAWLFVVDTSGSVQAFSLLEEGRKSNDLVAEIRGFLNGIEGEAARMKDRLLRKQDFDRKWQDRLHSFQKTLIPQAALKTLRQAKTVVVVPHHILHYFPFSALVTGRDTKIPGKQRMVQPKFLIDEKFDLIYAPSLVIYDQLRRSPGETFSKVGAIGIVDFPGEVPLPGVAKDLQNFKAAFGDHVQRILFAGEATETNVQKLLQEPGMVLISTHGQNEADHPLESFLLCLEDSQSDGRLTAGELFNSHIQANLIVMSACYSGLADKSPLPGDDLFGIQRAFLQSGARTVVSGLWDVYDGTAPDLMDTFFKNLAQGIPVSSALAESQRAFLNKRRASQGGLFAHPYFWAVYTVTGDDRTRFRRE